MGEKKVAVTVRCSKAHSVSVPKGTENLIEDLLERAGYSGEFEGILSKLRMGKRHTKGITVVAPRKHAVVLRVQPNDNGSRREVVLMTRPGIKGHDMFEVLQTAIRAPEATSDATTAAVDQATEALRVPIAQVAQETEMEKGARRKWTPRPGVSRVRGEGVLAVLTAIFQHYRLGVVKYDDLAGKLGPLKEEWQRPEGFGHHLIQMRRVGILFKCDSGGRVTTEDVRGFGILNPKHPQVAELSGVSAPPPPDCTAEEGSVKPSAVPEATGRRGEVNARLCELARESRKAEARVEKISVQLGELFREKKALKGQIDDAASESENLRRELQELDFAEKVEDIAAKIDIDNLDPTIKKALMRRLGQGQ